MRPVMAKAVGYMKPDIDPNTRLYVPFNEGVGSVAKDYSQYGNHAQLTDVEWGIGKGGSAGIFNGSSSLGNCGTSESLNIPDAIMISALVKSGDQTSFWSGIAGGDVGYFQSLNPTEHLQGYVYQSGAWKYSLSSETLPQGQWKHVVMLYDSTGGNIKLFIDAVEVLYTTQDTVTGTIDISVTNLYIGMYANVNYLFNGTIDEVRIYAKVPSAAQIAADCYEVVCN